MKTQKFNSYLVFLCIFSRPYSLNENYDDYEVHFSKFYFLTGIHCEFISSLAVMNYRYAQNLKKITCEEFVPLFDQQQEQAGLKWTDIQVIQLI